MVPVQGQLQGAAQGIRFGGSSGQGRCRVLLEDAAVRAVCAFGAGAAVRAVYVLWSRSFVASAARCKVLLSKCCFRFGAWLATIFCYLGSMLAYFSWVSFSLPFSFLASLLFAFLLSPASWLLCFSAVFAFPLLSSSFSCFFGFYSIYVCVCVVCNVCMYVMLCNVMYSNVM